MIGLGWVCFVCVMSDSISDLVVGNRDWSGGCLLSRSKAGLVVIRVCWLEWCVSCDELVG